MTAMRAKRLGALALAAVACTVAAREERAATTSGALAAGFVPAAPEQLARGAAAVAVDARGRVFVLDSVAGRIARVEGRELVPVAKVPRDADDLAIGPDGAFAVRRSVKPEVLVLDPTGAVVGAVDTSAVEDIDGIALGRSRRVVVTTPFQEELLVGSPSVPQLPAAIRASKREAAVAGIRTEGGELELRRGDARYVLGRGDAVRVVGARGDVACARIEHVDTDGDGRLVTRREAACVDLARGETLLRVELAPPGDALPRRELAFGGSTLAFARVLATGVSVTTWPVPEAR